MKIQVDAFVKIQSTFSDMVIQSFLKWGGGGGRVGIWGIFAHFLLGIWDTLHNI